LKILTYGENGFRHRLTSLSARYGVEILEISKIEDIPAVLEVGNQPDLAFIDRHAVGIDGVVAYLKSLSVMPIVFYVEENKEYWQGLEDYPVDGFVKDTCSTGEIIARLYAICRRVK
jgi:hypothetical protein